MIARGSLSSLGLPPTRGAGGGLAAQLDAQTAAGLHAFRLKLSDLSSLYLDDQAVGGNVSADAQTVGLALDKAQMDGKTADAFVAAQTELSNVIESSFEKTTDADLVVTNVAAVTDNVWYELTFDHNAHASTPGITFAGVTINGLIPSGVAGTVTVIIQADGTDATADLTLQGSASRHTLSGISLKEIPGVHFTQATTAKEPAFKKALKANADLSGQTELVTNGTFDSDISGWSAVRDAVLAFDAGRLKITGGATTFPSGAEDISSNIEQGKSYYISADVVADAGAQARVFIGDATASVSYGQVATVSAGATKTVNILLADVSSTIAANAHIHVGHVGSASGLIAYADNISVKEVPAPQLYNVLRGDGTDDLLTGSPFAYANGSAAFVFGVKGAAQDGVIYSERSTTDTDTVYSVLNGSIDNAKIRLIIRNDAGSIRLNAESTIDVFDGDPHVVTVIDTGTGYEFYVDGAAAGSGAYTRSGALTPNSAAILAHKYNTEDGQLAGDICDEFIVFEPGWTAGQIATAEAKIAQALGVTLS